MALHRFSATRLPATPWKNGGGVTREIIIRPADATLDTFAWRVSIAEVSADGPFSLFAGVDRVLILLDGYGVELRGARGRVIRRLDEAFVPFAFSGDDEITSSLIHGPSIDFNVMTRRGVKSADVRVLRGGDDLAQYRAGVIFAARGVWRLKPDGGEHARLETGDGLWWDGESIAGRADTDSTDAALIAVGVR